MKPTPLSLALFAALSTVCPLGLKGAVIITNGSFEDAATSTSYQNYGGGSTAITGWTTTLDGVEHFDPSSFAANSADSGQFIVDLAYVTSSRSGGIQQTVATVPGESFTLAFAATTSTGNGRVGTAEIVLMIDGSDVQTYSLNNPSTTFDWQNFTYTVNPTSTSTVIEFQNRQSANIHFANIDSVSVIPEPSPRYLAGSVF